MEGEMTTAITQETGIGIDALESILVEGNLEKLSAAQRLDYYAATCKSLGLNPLTKPFAYIKLSGKTTLYALKETTDQLRKIHGISVRISSREEIGESYVVTAFATDRDGRTDESTGAVPMEGLRGDAHSNALMKAETKAKRRVTLSIAGLGMLDETEVDTIANAQANVVDLETGEFIDPSPPVSKPAQPATFVEQPQQQAPQQAVVIEQDETEYGVCPLHNKPWRGSNEAVTAQFGKVMLSHYWKDISPKPYCQFQTVYYDVLSAAFEGAYGAATDDAVNNWLKNHYGNRTWSKLEWGEQLKAVAKLQEQGLAAIRPEATQRLSVVEAEEDGPPDALWEVEV
jgi:hypothetical protein